jgi:hypothetical protein
LTAPPAAIELVIAHAEAGGAGDAGRIVLVGDETDDEDVLLNLVEPERLLGGFGDDPLVGLAVDHYLPAARAYRLAAFLQRLAFVAGLLPDGQAPLLEVVHGVVHVATDVIDQILAGDAHEILAHVPDIVRGIVLAHVGVDGREALGNGAGSIHGGLVDELHFEVDALLPGFLDPLHDLERRTTGGHATADDEDIDLFFDYFRISKPIFVAHFSSR